MFLCSILIISSVFRWEQWVFW